MFEKWCSSSFDVQETIKDQKYFYKCMVTHCLQFWWKTIDYSTKIKCPYDCHWKYRFLFEVARGRYVSGEEVGPPKLRRRPWLNKNTQYIFSLQHLLYRFRVKNYYTTTSDQKLSRFSFSLDLYIDLKQIISVETKHARARKMPVRSQFLTHEHARCSIF